MIDALVIEGTVFLVTAHTKKRPWLQGRLRIILREREIELKFRGRQCAPAPERSY